MIRFFLILASIFYFPSILLAKISNKIGIILLKSAINKVGYPFYGYRSIIGWKLVRRSISDYNEIAIEAVAWSTQIKGEDIMKAIDASKEYEFVVKDERTLPESDRTVFLCKYLDSSTAAALGDSIYKVSGTGSARQEKLLSGTQQQTILKTCLKGWKNMVDDEGEPIAFDSKKPIEMIDMIPPKYRSEIADFIRGESEATEGEEAA